jgi:hypothetical protein
VQETVRTRKHILPANAFVWLLLLLTGSRDVLAQQRQVVKNLPKYDHQPVHFGFVLGMNSSGFRTEFIPDYHLRDTIYTITPSSVAGLNLGIISNIRIGNHFDLRFIPSLSFAQRNLEYFFLYAPGNGETDLKKVESTYLEFPVDLKFKSARINNYRIYVLAGMKYSIDMVSQAKVTNTDKELIKLKRYDYGYEIGIGFDFYMTYFKFSPEIKVYHGLPNLLVKDGTRFSNPLDGLYSQVFALSFTFE